MTGEKDYIEVEGIQLTPAVIETLKGFQLERKGDNWPETAARLLAEISCYVSLKTLDVSDDELKERGQILTDLAVIRSTFLDFLK